MVKSRRATQAPYHHGDLRQALLAAAERELEEKGIEGFSLRGVAKRAGLLNEGPGHTNPQLAKALLAEAGYADGFATKIYYRDVVRGYLPEPGLVAQDIQAQLKENLNIDASIEVQAFADPGQALAWLPSARPARSFVPSSASRSRAR